MYKEFILMFYVFVSACFSASVDFMTFDFNINCVMLNGILQ